MKISDQGYKYLRSIFPSLSDASIKERVLISPQIQEILKDGEFEPDLHAEEKDAWEAFRLVPKGVSRKQKGRKL